MTTETVTPAETTDQPERPVKTAAELEPGDWIAAGMIGETIVEVLSNVLYDNRAMFVCRAEGRSPDAEDWGAAAAFEMATPAEVAEAKDSARRQAIADQLADLASLIVRKKLPLPGKYHTLGVTFNFGQDIDPVDEAAAALGLEAHESYGTTAVVWPDVADQERGLLTATWSAYAKRKPKPEPERAGPWFDPGDRVYPRGPGGEVVSVTEVAPIEGSDPLRQQFRANGEKIWRHSDEYVFVPRTEPESTVGHPEGGRVTAPVHLVFVVGDTACGILPERTTDIAGTSVQEDVTCEGCLDALLPGMQGAGAEQADN